MWLHCRFLRNCGRLVFRSLWNPLPDDPLPGDLLPDTSLPVDPLPDYPLPPCWSVADIRAAQLAPHEWLNKRVIKAAGHYLFANAHPTQRLEKKRWKKSWFHFLFSRFFSLSTQLWLSLQLSVRLDLIIFRLQWEGCVLVLVQLGPGARCGWAETPPSPPSPKPLHSL